jgi:hypothetical protein
VARLVSARGYPRPESAVHLLDDLLVVGLRAVSRARREAGAGWAVRSVEHRIAIQGVWAGNAGLCDADARPPDDGNDHRRASTGHRG